MNDVNELPNIMTVDEVASYLRISKTTVCRWCNSGKLPAFRLGRSWRVKRHDMEAHINRAMTDTEQEAHAHSAAVPTANQPADSE
jgi:excisionase family DNA binding protein